MYLIHEVTMSEIKKLLGRRIQEIRKSKKIKQEELAELINIAPRNMSNIETGRCFPSPENIEKIANVLGVKIKDLFDFDHQQDDEDLFDGIVSRIKTLKRDKLQDFYKITRSLTD